MCRFDVQGREFPQKQQDYKSVVRLFRSALEIFSCMVLAIYVWAKTVCIRYGFLDV